MMLYNTITSHFPCRPNSIANRMRSTEALRFKLADTSNVSYVSLLADTASGFIRSSNSNFRLLRPLTVIGTFSIVIPI